MKIFAWLIRLPVHIGVILLRYPLAPVAVRYFSTPDKRRLTQFRWLETIDNDLSGDNGWKTEHIKPGSDPLSDENRIDWLRRNGGNAVNYGLLGISNEWAVRHDKPWLWRDYIGHWMIRKWIKIGPKYLELFWGWSLLGAKQGRCKFVFTTRYTSRGPDA